MRPHTSLSIWERVRLSKLAEFVIGECAIIFWLKGKETMLVERFRKHGFASLRDAAEKAVRACHFCDLTIDVIITTRIVDEQGLVYLETPPSRLVNGSVAPKDIAEGKNRLSLTLEDLAMLQEASRRRIHAFLLHSNVPLAEAQRRTGELLQQRLPKTAALLEQEAVRVLIHELTHLWQFRTGIARKAFEKNAARLNALKDRQRGLFDLEQAMLRKQDDPALLKELYLYLRSRLLSFRSSVCEEGVAEYLSHVLRDGAITPDGSYGPRCAETFEESLKAYALLATMPRKGDLLFVRHFKTFAKMRDLWTLASRRLGSTIPKILVQAGYPLETIVLMTDDQMLRAYEDACRDLGIKPYFAFRPGTDAVFNFGVAALRLNALRKKLGVR